MAFYSLSESSDDVPLEDRRKILNWAISVIQQGFMFMFVGIFIHVSAELLSENSLIVELESIVETAGAVFSILYIAVGLLILFTGLSQLIISSISDPSIAKDVLSNTRTGSYVISVIDGIR